MAGRVLPGIAVGSATRRDLESIDRPMRPERPTARALAEAIGLPDTFQDLGFVREPVQKGCRHDLVPKDGIPIRKAQVRRDNDRHSFIQLRAQLKQQLRSVFGKGNEA